MKRRTLLRRLLIVKGVTMVVTGFLVLAMGGWAWVLFSLSLIGTVLVAYAIEREGERQYRRLAWELYDFSQQFGGDAPPPPFDRPDN